MELSVVLSPDKLPQDANESRSDVISMQFSIPASITIRRPSRSPRVESVEKNKRLEYALPTKEIIDPLDALCVAAACNLSPASSKHLVSDLSTMVADRDQPSLQPLSQEVVEIPDP
jgi:hypothetical protein